ncbi:MAG: ABC transporter ATP-binding protein [Saprospiraceae bacterium]|nr:ABC transporter ATP-binding protein [Saprospiraceae bacterium]MBK6815396.1 ABC transporter ATP-binding protein [Saprospiraceae bacterium]MBK7439065.1 ABC transporter ATP-binding protein [Saprospiraceae bacterium]MBK9677652.1 ABC transporter ATP-binding protein [Saprospiraceae bacterium]MBP7802003.1 ABC transporter ATP-binding protein [Saprospiraceae bacterium]
MEGAPKKGFVESLKSLKLLIPFFKMIWRTSPALTLTNIILRLVKSAVPLAQLYIGKLIIDEIVHLINNKGGDPHNLWVWIGLEFGVTMVSELISRVMNLTESLLGDLYGNVSSVELMNKAATIDLSMYENPDFYDKLERARRQTTGRVVLMSMVLSQFQDIITILFLSAGLIAFEPWLIVLLIVAVLPSFISEAYFSRFSYSLVRSWTPQRRELDYLRYIGASVETAKEVKVFGLDHFLSKRFAKIADEYYQANKALAIKRTIWGTLLQLVSTTAYYGAYILIVIRTLAGVLTIGDLTFLSGSFNRLQNQLQNILSTFTRITESALYLQDYYDFLAIEPLIMDQPGAIQAPTTIKHGVRFDKVGFKYPGTEIWALRNISFTLNAGEKLALVGENGSGKTTLVKLIARMYDPTEGTIYLDEVDIKKFSLATYRQMIGVIFQDFVRFNFKADENIAVGKIESLSEEETVISSAHLSLADAVIEKLPAKYKQMLGRRFADGVDLSGGEWQKIALARAYMRNASIVILDEPTAALDARAEFEVFKRFSELTAGKTAVIISHRFSTVRMADRILVLKNGQMLELGSHEELLAHQGLYHELFTLQAQGYL